ncbi:MAG: FAD-dependent oxidoreductase [Acidobacteriota bacterium]
MKRREALGLLGALGASVLFPRRARAARAYDVVVIGAGVFGTWTAWYLQRAGKRVALIDAVGPAHSGASSGGESRVTRCAYGGSDLYTDWACRSIAEWQDLSQRASLPLFHQSGVLWLHREGEPVVDSMAKTLGKFDLPFQRLSATQLRSRFPVLSLAGDEAGFFEPRGGALMARRAVQVLAAETQSAGTVVRQGRALPISSASGVGGGLPHVELAGGERLSADQFVFACGPWLDRVCPEAMGGRLFVTRQEVLYFASSRELTGTLPVWADLPFYGIPNVEGRGFKVADDTHGDRVDPDTLERRVRDETVDRARAFLARRFPRLADRPLNESRVCQYENSSSGDLVIDRHPGLDNVWLVGCGSGHGFKHGPAVGAHLSSLVEGKESPIELFSLASKRTEQRRAVQ